jgi:hypothetical protein
MVTSSHKSPVIEQPLINSIPADLHPRFDPTYVEYHNKYNAGRLATHQVPIEDYRKDPLKYTISYGRQLIDQGNLIITEQRCPVEGVEITIRIFQPDHSLATKERRPVYINFHGGGWVFGGLARTMTFARDWCTNSAALLLMSTTDLLRNLNILSRWMIAGPLSNGCVIWLLLK